MSSSPYALAVNSAFPQGWKGYLVVGFLSMSCLCSFELGVLTIALWNKNSRIYFWSMTVANFCSLCFTIGVLIFFFAPNGPASQWLSMLLATFGYWIYVPAQFMVMYTRLHLLRPSRRVMMVCKVILIAQWFLITTPNAILSAGAAFTTKYKFPDAYSILQRIEPAIYAFVSFMLSSLYLYYAFIMFQRYGDKKVRLLLIRLLYANTLLILLDSGNIIAEYAGGAIIQTGYVAFLYAFQLKIELWMLNEIGLLASETLERSRILRSIYPDTDTTRSYS